MMVRIGFLGGGILFVLAAISWVASPDNCASNDSTSGYDPSSSWYLVFFGGLLEVVAGALTWTAGGDDDYMKL